MSASRRGTNNGFYGKQHPPEVRRKISERVSAAQIGRPRPWQLGENNPNWNGGTSFEPYCRLFNKSFKKECRDLWGNICGVCGQGPNGKELHVHHIHYDKAAGCNGRALECIPLCQPHNAKANGNREWWIAYFENRLWKIFGWHVDLVPEEGG